MKLFPSQDFAEILPSNNAKDYVSESHSLSTIASSAGAQRFEFALTTAWERLPLARALWMFLNARSQSEKFLIQLPVYDTPNGVVGGAVSTMAAYAVGTSDILLSNYTAAIGDFIQFAGHSKVYGVEDVNGALATIYPPLLKSIANNESVNVNNLQFTVRRVGDISKLESNKKSSGKVKFKVIEAF